MTTTPYKGSILPSEEPNLKATVNMTSRIPLTKWGSLLTLMIVVTFTILYTSFFSKFTELSHVSKKNKPALKLNKTHAEKWVVITSIFEPTKSIKMLSGMQEWQVVVVGDKKTPAHWSWPNVIYLGVEEQEALGYNLLQHLSWNSFPRKALGYLYAMQHGAKMIYETDDDNAPMGDLSTFGKDNPYRLVLKNPDKVFNPHMHFGQSSTWPRGYPLDKIGYPSSFLYFLCVTPEPVVVQGLVNGDPDIDAIYRLTRKFSLERIDIKFDEKSPLFIYPSNTYTPYNCQNTWFHKSAFWSMVLPISVTDRATDIFRAYWAERLMALVGQRLAFAPASFYQLRSPHNLLKDFDKEGQIYLDTPAFIDLLEQWSCSSQVFAECILQLTRTIVDRGIYKEKDYDLIEAWIKDLQAIDPSLLDLPISQATGECIKGSIHEVAFHSQEQLTTMPHDPRLTLPEFISHKYAIIENFKTLCNRNYSSYLLSLELNNKALSQYLLVINLVSGLEEDIKFFLTYYKLYFEHILFCTETRPSPSFLKQWKASMIFFERSLLSQASCMAAASKMDYNVTGFFFMPEHMMLNVHTQISLEQKKTVAWLPRVKNLFLQKEKCINVDCLSIKVDHLKRLGNVSKMSDQGGYFQMKQSIRHNIDTILKSGLKEENGKVNFFTSFPAYLPRWQLIVFHQIESAFKNVLQNNQQLLMLVFYLTSYSGNSLVVSKYTNSSSPVDFYTNYACSNVNVKCLCEL